MQEPELLRPTEALPACQMDRTASFAPHCFVTNSLLPIFLALKPKTFFQCTRSAETHELPLCRSSPAKQVWPGLPNHLFVLVLIKLQKAGGVKAAAVTRLVCKAWLEAFSDLPGEMELKVKEEADKPLKNLCKMMPSLSALAIRSTYQQLDFSPLGACLQLTKLMCGEEGEYYNSFEDRPTLSDLSMLPSSLKEIVISCMRLTPEALNDVKFVGLTKLTCFNTSKQWQEVWNLLGCLPALEVRSAPEHLLY